MGPPVFSSDYSASGEHTLIAGRGLVLRANEQCAPPAGKSSSEPGALSSATMVFSMILRGGVEKGKPLKLLDRQG
jgi:hypothetical protein